MTTKEKEQSLQELGPGVMFREGVESLTKDRAKFALQHFRQVIRQSKRVGDTNKVGRSLLHMAMVLRGQRQYDTVLQVLEQARTIFENNNNKAGLASVYHEFSLAHREFNRNALALEYAHKAITIFQELGRTLELGWVYDNLAVIHFNLYRRDEILNYAEKARAIFMEMNSQIGLAWNACTLGGLYSDMGLYNRSERYYVEARDIFKKCKSTQGVAWSVLGLGMVLRRQYRFEEAAPKLEKARQMYEDMGLKDRLAWCLLNEAPIKRALGRLDESLQINKKALQHFGPLRNNDGVAWSLLQIGQIYRDNGYFIKSWQTLRDCLNLQTDISNKKGIGWSSNECGKTYLELNDQSHARDALLKAKVIAEKLEEGALKAEVDKNIAQLNIEEGMLQRARDILDRVVVITDKISSRETQIEAYFEQARLAAIVGDGKTYGEALIQAENLIKKCGLRRLEPTLKIFQAEHMCCQKRVDQVYQSLVEAHRLAGEYGQRRVQTEALLGLIQIGFTGYKIEGLSKIVREVDKSVRIFGSRKMKAKSLLVRGLMTWHKTKKVDSRSFRQALQILNMSGLTVLEIQAYQLVSRLYADVGNEKEKAFADQQIKKRVKQGSIDLHLIRPRHDICTRIPVSLVI